MADHHGDDPTETFDDEGLRSAGESGQPGAGGRRPSGEGVRIIGAEEAAAAIESGQVSGRQPDDVPRFGDVPDAPSGPRPPLRFPMADADPGAVVKPPVVDIDGGLEREVEDSQSRRRGGFLGRRGGRSGDAPPVVASPGTGSLPHWTEPPSGEVPRILADAEAPEPEVADDLAAWSAVSGGARWRDQRDDWQDADYDNAILQDPGPRLGALQTDQPEDEDDFFDQPADPVAPPTGTTRIRTGVRSEQRRPSSGPQGPSERDLPAAVASGLFIGGVVLASMALGPAAFLVVATAAVTMAAGELYQALHGAGYHPATLLGLVGTASLMGAAYWRGEQAFPLVLALVAVFSLLWYLAGVVRAEPVGNIGVTLLAFMYVGFLGSFAALLLKFPRHAGVRHLLAAIVATVAYDIGAFFVGRWAGRTPLAPNVSPNKTWEGAVGASVATLVVCLTIVPAAISPWTAGRGFGLALLVIVAAPLGDLCQSMIKRDLGIKDMGSILPGHGGVLDRIDALLFVIPATYYLVRLLKIA